MIIKYRSVKTVRIYRSVRQEHYVQLHCDDAKCSCKTEDRMFQRSITEQGYK